MKVLTFVVAVTTLLVPSSGQILKVPLRHSNVEQCPDPAESDSIERTDQIPLHQDHKHSPGHSIPLHGLPKSHYTTNITLDVFSRPQEVSIDTAISTLWLPNSRCDPDSETCSTTARIGDLRIEEQRFVGFIGFNPLPFDGLMGLAPCSDDPEDGVQTVFCNMVAQGLLEKEVFGLWLGDGEGEIAFGGVEQEHYEGDVIELPLRNETDLWEVDFDALTFGEHTVELEENSAIIDSGTTVITLPSSLSGVLHREMGAEQDRHGIWHVDCEDRTSLPDLTFTLAGEKFSLTPFEYIVETEGKCKSAIIGLDVHPLDGHRALLGVPFLRRWYSSFNAKGPSVGFAKARTRQ